MDPRVEANNYFREASAAELAFAAGDEIELDEHLAELAGLAVNASSAVLRRNAAKLVEKFGYEERFAQREAEQLASLSDALAAAAKQGDWAGAAALSEELDAFANEAENQTHREFARWLLSRHFAAPKPLVRLPSEQAH